eukprot:3051364-Prymnesium_polylepis.1
MHGRDRGAGRAGRVGRIGRVDRVGHVLAICWSRPFVCYIYPLTAEERTRFGGGTSKEHHNWGGRVIRWKSL